MKSLSKWISDNFIMKTNSISYILSIWYVGEEKNILFSEHNFQNAEESAIFLLLHLMRFEFSRYITYKKYAISGILYRSFHCLITTRRAFLLFFSLFCWLILLFAYTDFMQRIGETT